MASLEKQKGTYRIVFWWDGRRIYRSLRTASRRVAESYCDTVERRIAAHQRGELSIPDRADIATFLLSGQAREPNPQDEHSSKQPRTIGELFTHYFASLPVGALEENTLYTQKLHRKHIERILGKRFPIKNATKSELQRYVNERAKEKTRKGTVGPATIRMELATLSAVWSHCELGQLPKRGLKYPKDREKPPFQTWKEIERQVAAGADEELWEALFLNVTEIEELLTSVKETAALECMHPMLALAAYTGARRSELLRSQRTDINDETVTLREKKRVKGKNTTRTVPIPKQLRPILTEWLATHSHSRTFGPLTIDQSNHYLKRSLTGKWSKIRGWHTFRHSFASNCAAAGVDQRMINAWMGHQTEEMMRRYQHLFPDDQRTAIDSVFG